METLKEDGRTEREQARNVPASCKTTDPIEEAVARAIWEAEGGRWPIEDSGWRRDYFNKARAAIVAHLAALEAAGFVIVSADVPTEAMATLAQRVCSRREERLRAGTKNPLPHGRGLVAHRSA